MVTRSISLDSSTSPLVKPNKIGDSHLRSYSVAANLSTYTDTQKKLRRAFLKAKAIGKGLAEIEKQGFKGKQLKEYFWLEAPSGKYYYNEIKPRFEEWRNAETLLCFEEWIKVNKIEFTQTIIYLNRYTRVRYEVDFVAGKLVKNGIPYPTSGEVSKFSGAGFAIFVIGPDKKLYTGSHQIGVFHHSSFFAGGAVIGAGEILSDELGVIKKLTNKSGHYRLSVDEVLDMLRVFVEKGVDLSLVELTVISENNSFLFPSAAKFMESPTGYVEELKNQRVSGVYID